MINLAEFRRSLLRNFYGILPDINGIMDTLIKGLCWGRDSSEVKMSGRPASVGLEDRYLV